MCVCAICGINKASTRDHVPPKAIFPKPRPGNLITVPACAACNNGASQYDDLFKVYLSMQCAGASEIARHLFTEKTVRTLERNQALLTTIARESRDISFYDENGDLVSRTGVLWNSEAHDVVIKRTIRGLYFRHTGNVFPADAILKVHWLHEVPEDIESKLHLFSEVTIGENQVIYKYLISEQDPLHSLWVFDFYGAHWASGYTSPKEQGI